MIFSVGYGVKNFDTICENALHETSEVPCSIVRLFSIVLLHVFPGMLSGLFCDPEEHQIIRKDQKRKTERTGKYRQDTGRETDQKKADEEKFLIGGILIRFGDVFVVLQYFMDLWVYGFVVFVFYVLFGLQNVFKIYRVSFLCGLWISLSG
ncbi:MAG: hypothetical protein II940_03930 [Methanosarcinaceae archaeon]|nr:hypothetical protein [Methanosarcinaceae archaeon]